MGIKNYLIDGLSGTGKTTVAAELRRRGYHVIDGDNELAYYGDPETGEPAVAPIHESEAARFAWQYPRWLWDIDKIKALMADRTQPITFFCGGSRNSARFVDLFDGVFILEVGDLETLYRRIDARMALDPTDWGGKPEERALLARLYETRDGISKNGFFIDSTAPITHVVDEILSKCETEIK